MKILITGHCGYIGPVLIKLCHELGHEIIGIDTNFFKDLFNDIDKIYIPDHEIKCDIRDIEKKFFESVDGVIHLAALSNDPLGDIAAKQTYSINTLGTIKCATLAKESGVKRFAFASSCSIYGASKDNSIPLNEGSAVAPVSAYAISKVESEKELLKLSDESFQPIMLRNATAYGVSPRMRLDLVLGNLMAIGYSTGIIKVMSDGTPWRPLVHIEDISSAAIASITSPEFLKHSIFNIGSENCNYTVKEIAETAAKQLPDCEILITGENGNDPRSYRVDFSRALKELPGFNPKWNLNNGAIEMKKWLINNFGKDGFVIGNQYIRLSHLKNLIDNKKINDEFRWI